MITIEGVKVKAKMITREKAFSLWKTLTRKPFPRIAAFQLNDADFDYAIKLRKCRDDERREIKEWGRVLSAKGTDACVFNCEEFPDVDYIILIRENPYHGLEEILEHELSHIARGDL
jgi:hypothetical protein